MSMHLDEEALAALAFEEPIDAAQQAHLDGCAACQTRALEARAMVGDVNSALDMLELEPEPEPVDDNAPPTRAEMEQQAALLGIDVDRRWSDKTLLAKIAAATDPT